VKKIVAPHGGWGRDIWSSWHMALLTKHFRNVNHFIVKNMGSVFGTIDVEMPAYSVTRKTESYEVREYPEGEGTSYYHISHFRFVMVPS
jgi:hypothetical protein